MLEVVFIRSSQLMMLDSSNFTLLYIFQINLLSSGNVIHVHDPSPKKTEGKLVACGNCKDSNGVAGEQTNNGKNVCGRHSFSVQEQRKGCQCNM